MNNITTVLIIAAAAIGLFTIIFFLGLDSTNVETGGQRDYLVNVTDSIPITEKQGQ